MRRGRLLEYLTLGWNVVGVAVLTFAAITAGSVAAAGFGLDSLIEIGASTVVLWQLADTVDPVREHRAIRLIGSPDRARLVRRGRLLEFLTLGWNVVGVAVLAFAAITAGSVAAAGFGLDSMIEIGASTVVLWQLADTVDAAREHRAMRLMGVGFLLLVIYLVVQVGVVFATRSRPAPSPVGIGWTAANLLW